MRAIRRTTNRKQGCRWVFTLNNYNDIQLESLRLLGETVKYLVFGREVAPSTGTPHLQGFIIFDCNHSLTKVKSLFPTGNPHLDVAKGTSTQAATYCKKDHDFEEFGSLPNERGKTNRYDDFRDFILASETKPSLADVAREFPSIFLTSGRIQSFIDLIYPTPPAMGLDYRPRQQRLADRLDGEPDDRKILFVVDPVGNSGKSWFATQYALTNPARVQLLSIGRREDLSFALNEQCVVFIFDFPRSSQEFMPYTFLEQLKDGRVFSTKYESRMKTFKTPWVVVMTNEYPDMSKLSQDRYDITVWNYEME
jgi:Putative viral replication protein